MPSYHRDYADQAVHLAVRINSHIHTFMRWDKSTLHHYVYQLGRGHCTVRFIQTFRFSADGGMEYGVYLFYLTVLEMVSDEKSNCHKEYQEVMKRLLWREDMTERQVKRSLHDKELLMLSRQQFWRISLMERTTA